MIPIHEMILASIEDKNYRCRDVACSFYKLTNGIKNFPSFTFFELCGRCRDAMQISLNEDEERLERLFVEACRGAGNTLVVPPEVVKHFERMADEISKPDGVMS